jgi:hypothetical protein
MPDEQTAPEVTGASLATLIGLLKYPSQSVPPTIAQAIEHQRRWGMPPATEQIPGIITNTVERTVGGPIMAAKRLGEAATSGTLDVTAPETAGQAFNLVGGITGQSFPFGEPGAIGALTLNKRFNLPGGTRGYEMINEEGQQVGRLTANWTPHKRDIYISDVTSNLPSPHPHGSIPAQANSASGSLGFGDLRSVVDALKQEFPRAETISGLRASGSRYGPAGAARGTEGASTSIRIRKSQD